MALCAHTSANAFVQLASMFKLHTIVVVSVEAPRHLAILMT